MSQTPHLSLPLLAAAQAQKHVTHNEALAALDALVHLAVKERDRAVAPATPAEGDRYLVGEDATGAFAGHDGQLAVYDLGVWRFFEPRAGWQVYIEAEDRVVVHDGTAWQSLGRYAGDLDRVDRLGVGTSPDDTNRFAAKLNAALFTAQGEAEQGTGDLRFVLNKEGSGKVLSQLYQSGYSGRAETGLIGDDQFRIRVSEDGAAWRDAMRIEPATGTVIFPAGSQGQGGFGNLLINAEFSVNQRVFAGGFLSYNNYGFDRWKGGAGGCTLTRAADGTVTLNGPLIQVIEMPGLAGEVVTVSVENPSGPLLVDIEGATATIDAGSGRRSVTLTVPGTATANVTLTLTGSSVSFARPVLNRGDWTERFVRLPPGLNLLLCQRYFIKTFAPGTVPAAAAGLTGSLFTYAIVANAIPNLRWQFPVPMRSTPVVTYLNPNSNNTQWSVGGVNAITIPGSATTESVRIGTSGTPTINAGTVTYIHAVASAEL
jgi:hypothetical protein